MQNGSLRGPKEDMLPNTAVHEDDGRTALHDAAAIGDEKTLHTLLNAGVNRNAKDRKHGNTPLHEAAWRGFSRSVKLLCALPPLPKNIKQRSGLNESKGALHSTLLGTRNSGGFSALHLAAQNGHNQSCREILLAGADPDVQNNYGDTPLHTACRYGHAGATRILISAKCDPNRTNLNGDSPLHIACAMGRRKLTRILLEAGASIEITNAQNENPKDIAVRKKLTEIMEILSSPIEVKPVKKERERSSSNSKSNKDKVDGSTPDGHRNKSKRTDLAANPVNWSPYGCHYFPDPRTFPAPKLDTLPKEPLTSGEQYFLDLAGNIRKGPIGVGNTCYCGPFFRHIEERISKNRKSLKKYVHKATERLDNKVQALALKTDDQIEQLTKSMLADRIRCDGRRLHLEQWLRRGDPHRTTTGCHQSKSKKNCDNANRLIRCKSLELLNEASDGFPKIPNSKSFEVLDENQITVHCDAEGNQSTISDVHRSQADSRRRTRKTSERSKSSGDHTETSQIFTKTGPQNVSQRLEQLLAKTNEILEIEKHTRRRNKEGLLSAEFYAEGMPKRRHSKLLGAFYTNDGLANGLSSKNHSAKSFSLDESENCQEIIENAMKQITSSLGHNPEKDSHPVEHVNKSHKTAFDLKEFAISQKEQERRSEQEHEKSSILSNSSHRNLSSIGSGYIPDFNQQHMHNGHLRVSRNSKSVTSENSSKTTTTPTKQQLMMDHFESMKIMSNAEDMDNLKLNGLISALKKDYRSTKDNIESKIRRQCIENATSEEEDDDQDEISLDNYRDDHHHLESLSDDDGDVDGSDYRHRDKFYSPEDISEFKRKTMSLGIFQNESFEDVIRSPNSGIDGETCNNNSMTKDYNDTANSLMPEISPASELNDLKKRILNGNNWKSQMLRKTQQIFNLNGYSKDVVDGKGDLNSSAKAAEVMNLKPPTHPAGALRRSKVQELVAKIQGQDMQPLESDSKRYSSNSNDDLEHENIYQKLYSAKQENNNTGNSGSHYNGDLGQMSSQSQSTSVAENPKIPNPNQYNLSPGNLIPKDAYFHEIPNKNHMRPIADKLPEKQLINFQHNHPLSKSISDNHISNVSPTLLASRTRNPLPYHLTSSDYSNITQLGSELSLEKPSYRNYTNLNSNLVPIDPPSGANHSALHIHKQNHIIPMPAVRHFIPHQHNQHPHADKYQNATYNNNPPMVIQQQQHNYATPPTRVITPEQAQFERDLSNDSGFSTKLGGSSLGPSPIFTSNDYALMHRNANAASNLHNHTNKGFPSSEINTPSENPNNVHYYIGNTSSLV